VAEARRIVAAFAASVVAMAVAGTLAQTHFVLAALERAGAPIMLSDRLAMSAADLVGFAPLYAAIVAAGFAVAFLVGGLVRKWLLLPRILVFAVAGAGCIALMLYLMQAVFFGIPLIAGTRTVAGALSQIGLGAVAGAIFAKIISPMREGAPNQRNIAT
jgi:hypothetical protein